MRARNLSHRVVALFVMSAVALVTATPVSTARTQASVLYRIFLDSGETLTSYGEYARVDQRVVLSLPVGPLVASVAPRTQLVSVPAARIDWEATDRYANAARYAHFAATRGAADYDALSRQVARSLEAIARLDDKSRALRLARATRQRIVAWSEHAYGYREQDTHQIVALLDEAISALSVSVGEPSLMLSLIATSRRPPPVALLPKPDLQDVIVQTLIAARLTPVPAEAVSLLQMAATLLRDDDDDLVPRRWREETRRDVRDSAR